MNKGFWTLFVLIIAFVTFGVLKTYQDRLNTYVTSRSSKFCYAKGSENKNIRTENKVYFEDLITCGKPLQP